jgi:hypothetical protein
MGSSLIERTAASFSGCSDCQTLEMWRKKKEDGKNDPKLKDARDKIKKDLSLKTRSTLAYAKKKLFRREQLHDVRIIFGGGGHCHHPYKTAVIQPFSGDLFPIGGIFPSIIGLQRPRDLELENQNQHWMNRLYVAYGLSFVKTDLINFTYPKDVTDPESDEIWNRSKIIPEAPTKDVC